LSSLEHTPDILPSFAGFDKIEHFLEYYVFGYILLRAIIILKRQDRSRYASFIVIAVGILYSISDEWHQSFVPGRDPSITDVMFDGLGIITAVLTFRPLRNWLKPLSAIEKFFEETLQNEKRIGHHN
jgi:VanZ family protein